jgi:hypothetical protein
MSEEPDMNTTTTKIAGEAMTDEQIKDLAKQHYAMYDHWQIDLVGFARALLASKPAVPQTLSDGAQYFARYLIDNCENEVIREESVQAWLGKMLASPRYHPTAPAQSTDDARAAVDFYAANPSAALVDFQKRFAPAQSCGEDDAERADTVPQIKPRLLSQLRRFNECCEDSEAGGHDVDKEDMHSLAELGAVRPAPGGRHYLTDFGHYLLAARTQDSK